MQQVGDSSYKLQNVLRQPAVKSPHTITRSTCHDTTISWKFRLWDSQKGSY